LRISHQIAQTHIRQYIEGQDRNEVVFSCGEARRCCWAGLVSAKWLEQKYKKPNQRIENGLQTNGTLLNDGHHPPGASLWGVRLQFVLRFPKLTKPQEKMVLEQKLAEQMNQEPPKK
jgi:hypothetical protein